MHRQGLYQHTDSTCGSDVLTTIIDCGKERLLSMGIDTQQITKYGRSQYIRRNPHLTAGFFQLL